MPERRDEIRALLALTQVKGLGAHLVRRLVDKFGSARSVFSEQARNLKRVERIGPTAISAISEFNGWDVVDQSLDKTDRLPVDVISIQDDEYPLLLRQLPDAPVLLWIWGDKSLLNLPGIAVVGTRKPSQYGIRLTRTMSSELSEHGLCIFSGLAIGVDAVAHKAALDAQGPTVAVLGSGIDWLYPAVNKHLARRIASEGGAVITEFAPGTKPDAQNFPARNRIVSGLSLGTLVIETGLQGGSMITARIALDQNREVFVLPHAADSKTADGNHVLIQKGFGKLVTKTAHILEELNLKTSVDQKKDKKVKQSELSDTQLKVWDLMNGEPVHFDQLLEGSPVSINELNMILLELEFEGRIRQLPGKRYCRI